MKTIIYLSIALFFSLNGTAQNKDYLDQKNGIKDFKLGDSFDKWKKDLQLVNAETNAYKYIGSCCQDLFGRNVTNISLMFENNKVVMIYFETHDITKYNPNGYYEFDFGKYIEDELMNLFGKPDKIKTSDDMKGSHYMYFWVTNKLRLTVTTTYGSVSDGKLEAKCTLVDETFAAKKMGDGF